MKKQELEYLRRSSSDGDFIKGESVNDEPRTLIYGYTLARETFHAYLDSDRKINVVIYEHQGNVVDHIKEGKNGIRVKDLIPSKRAYPERCDFHFSMLLKSKGVDIPFTAYPEDVEAGEKHSNNKYHGKLIHELFFVNSKKVTYNIIPEWLGFNKDLFSDSDFLKINELSEAISQGIFYKAKSIEAGHDANLSKFTQSMNEIVNVQMTNYLRSGRFNNQTYSDPFELVDKGKKYFEDSILNALIMSMEDVNSEIESITFDQSKFNALNESEAPMYFANVSKEMRAYTNIILNHMIKLIKLDSGEEPSVFISDLMISASLKRNKFLDTEVTVAHVRDEIVSALDETLKNRNTVKVKM